MVNFPYLSWVALGALLLPGCTFPRNCHDPKAEISTGLIVQDVSAWITDNNEPIKSCAELCVNEALTPQDVYSCEILGTRDPEAGDKFVDGKTYWPEGGIGGASDAAHFEETVPEGSTTIDLKCTVATGCD